MAKANRARPGRGHQANRGTYVDQVGVECWYRVHAVGHPMFDPRLVLEIDIEERDRRDVLADIETNAMVDEMVAAGQPILIPRFRIRGEPLPGDAPAWWGDRTITWVTIDADDVVRPAEAPMLDRGPGYEAGRNREPWVPTVAPAGADFWRPP